MAKTDDPKVIRKPDPQAQPAVADIPNTPVDENGTPQPRTVNVQPGHGRIVDSTSASDDWPARAGVDTTTADEAEAAEDSGRDRDR